MNALIYQLHPALVHFPIALLTMAAFFEWGMPFVAKGQAERWQWAALGMLCAGVVFAGLSIATGLWAEDKVPFIPSAGDMMEWHERAGIATGVLALVLALWRLRRRPPSRPSPAWLYATLWVLLVAIVLAAGWLGGRLVHEFGVGVG